MADYKHFVSKRQAPGSGRVRLTPPPEALSIPYGQGGSMFPSETAQCIKDAALSLGYEACGIIPVAAMKEYAAKLDERVARFPESRPMYSRYAGFAELKERYPRAASVVVCARWYGQYRLPVHLEGVIAKSFLLDSRKEPRSREYRDSLRFEARLQDMGLWTEAEREYGITGLRWAAMQAGMGIIRRNNFFYTTRGSWIRLEAWLIDAELELRDSPSFRPCPKHCSLCIKACPSGSLAGPFATNGVSCVSFLTTRQGCMPGRPHMDTTGAWIFGCDACQDACPFNRTAWSAEDDFPGLAALGGELSYQQILGMDYDRLRALMPPKFWYIGADEVWKWKTNVLNAMRNRYAREYGAHIEAARHDEHANVRQMAEWVWKAVSERDGSLRQPPE